MRFGFFILILLALLALRPGVLAQDLPVMKPVVWSDGELQLSWKGGQAPFTLQESFDLRTWTDSGNPLMEPGVRLKVDQSSRFFRVLSSEGSGIELGELFGQLRVFEGEFGLPLARHRLKSTWDFHEPVEGAPGGTPANFFTSLIVNRQYLENGEMKTTVGPLSGLPGVEMKLSGQNLTYTWEEGTVFQQRTYTLAMTFPYKLEGVRFQSLHLSDPVIKLTCDYVFGQEEWEFGKEKLARTKQDVVDLTEFPRPEQKPFELDRAHTIVDGGVTVETSFVIGTNLRQGEVPFIFKTFILQRWGGTTISGLTETPFELKGRFSQSYFPFHHNFIETLWLEPALEEGLDPAILTELKEKDIRFIVSENPSAFPEQSPSIQLVGFDGKIRKP